MITGNPEADFFEMEDVFRQESFLLYSPGVSGIMEKERPIMWFNLIAFNGECWETYGPIHYYKGFEPEDIFFFATELNPDQYIEDDEDVIADIEKNPIPYMMLFSGGNIPITVHREDQIVCYAAWYDMQNFKTAGLEQDFKIEYNAEVYRLSLKGWDEYPHFSTAYYDEKEEELFLSSMTDRGFDALTGRFNSLGYNFAEEADVRVNPVMLSNAGRILGKKITLDEYAVLFKRESSPEAQAEINKINDFMQMALPYINAGETPDVEDLAKNAGVDIETARDLLQHVMNKFDDMDKRRNG